MKVGDGDCCESYPRAVIEKLMSRARSSSWSRCGHGSVATVTQERMARDQPLAG
jgi:hypothetical protein